MQIPREEALEECARVEDHRNWAWLPRHGVLDGKLCHLNSLDRIKGDKGALCDGGHCSRQIVGAIIAEARLIKTVMGVAAALCGVQEHEHRRGPEVSLHDADAAVAGNPRTLSHDDSRASGQPAIRFGHNAADRLLAHEDPLNVANVAQSVEDLDGVAARQAENNGSFHGSDHLGYPLGAGRAVVELGHRFLLWYRWVAG